MMPRIIFFRFHATIIFIRAAATRSDIVWPCGAAVTPAEGLRWHAHKILEVLLHTFVWPSIHCDIATHASVILNITTMDTHIGN